MRATIVGILERKFNDRSSQIERKTIADNSFEEIDITAAWLEQLLAEKIRGKKTFRRFEKAITSSFKVTLQKGDDYYFRLFRREKIINENTADKELSNPFTSVVQDIYNGLFKNNHSFANGLTIYRELRLHIEKEIGKLLGKDGSFQSFETWLKVYEKLEVEHDIYRAWIRSISLDYIIAEKDKFSVIKEPELDKLASLRGYGRNNKSEAKNYITHLKKISSKPVFEFITEVTRGSDLLELKSAPELQHTLSRRLGTSEWLLFIDSLYYPNLQDHVFLAINEIVEYPDIIENIVTHNELKTPKEHLLLIALENYYDFVCRTITDLAGLAERHYNNDKSIEIEGLKLQVSDEYNRWIKDYIPASFNRILHDIFPDKELHQSPFFLLFFEWMNSHSRLHLVYRGNEGRKLLIDTLNELFLIGLNANKSGRDFLIKNLQTHQVNYEALNKLVSIYGENKDDLDFRDKLYLVYENFIGAETFNWQASENVDFEEAINNAYYFSQILCSYEDAYKRWHKIFRRHKTSHEGWQFTYADYKIYQRESFILTAGIGMVYFKYSNTKENAEMLSQQVNKNLIQQHRNAGERGLVDYVTPLKFAAITTSKYNPQGCEDFLKFVNEKFDGLKYVLIAITELKEYNNDLHFTEAFKQHIRNRIRDEFWVIEHQKTGGSMKDKLNYYIELMNKALEVCL